MSNEDIKKWIEKKKSEQTYNGMVTLENHPNKKIKKKMLDFEAGFINEEKFNKLILKDIKNSDIKEEVLNIVEKNIDTISYVMDQNPNADSKLLLESQKKYRKMMSIISKIDPKKRKSILGIFG